MSEEDRDKRAFPLMQPRDILTPTATLLALSVASIALIASIMPQNPDIVQNFAKVMIGIVIVFVATAIATSLATFLRRASIWRFAILIYIVGWVYLGGVLLILFIGYATGIESFQLPQFNISIGLGIPSVISILSFIVASAVIYWQFKVLAGKLDSIRAKIKADTKKVEQETKRVLAIEDKDVEMSVVKKVIEIETKLRDIATSIGIEPSRLRNQGGRQIARELFRRKTIDKSTMAAIDEIWHIRNYIVHGARAPRGISNMEARAALNLATAVGISLDQLDATLSERRQT